MTKTGLNASELARRTDLPASTIKKIRNRDNPNPTLATLLPIARFFSISLSQLIGDEPINGFVSSGFQTVPLLSWSEAITWPKNSIDKATIKIEARYSDKVFALEVENEEWDKLNKGTILFIEPNIRPEHRDWVLIHKIGQTSPSLRQIMLDDEHLYLKPLTAGYSITHLTAEHKILGVVMEFRKQLKSNLHNNSYNFTGVS